MGKFDGLLFVSDLDGTLLRNDTTISEKNKKAIEYFENEGGKFSFITGRIAKGAEPILRQLTPNFPFGCINGGGIYDAAKKEYLWIREVPESVMELVAFVRNEFPHIGIELVTFDGSYFCHKNEMAEKHRLIEEFEDRVCHYSEVKEPLSKVLFLDTEDKMPPLKEALKKHPLASQFEFVSSAPEYYEVLPEGSSKGSVLLKLADILGVAHDKTISVGDNDNDVSMLKAAKIGFAVYNASDSAKKCADYITVSNEDDAIAKIIEDLDSKKFII